MGSVIGITNLHPITTDNLFKIYIDLYLYKSLSGGQAHTQEAVLSILGNFEILNQRIILNDGKFQYDDSLARSDEELNGIISRLRTKVDQAKFNKLFYRDEDGMPFGRNKFSIKEYLENLRDVLMSWQEPDEEDRDNVDHILYLSKFLIDNLEPLSTGTSKFSVSRVDDKPSELERGMDLLKVAQYLFGPQTFRLILFRSLWYFASDGKYNVLPLSILPEDLSEYVLDLGIISSTQRKSTLTNEYMPLATATDIRNHIPSLLLGNSFFNLPVDDGSNIDSTFYFGYGPLPFISDSISIPKFIDSYELNQYIGRLIFNQFELSLNKYKIDNHITDPSVSKVNLGMTAYEDIFSVVEDKVIRHFTSKSGDIAQNLEDAFNILIEARRELLSFTNDNTANMLLKGVAEDTLRLQFIKFFQNPIISTTKIYFYSTLVDGKIPWIEFSKNDFAGKFTQMTGNTHASQWSAFDYNYIEQYNARVIDNRVDVLKKLIESQPEGSRNVRIFIGQNIGSSSDLSTDYGYQYIEATTQSPKWIPKTEFMTSQGKAPSYIDVSFEEGTYKEFEMQKLRYLVLLSLAMELRMITGVRPNQEYEFNYRDFIFIIKKADSSVNDPNYIAIFNHHYITQLMPIHSSSEAPSSVKRGFTKINLECPYKNEIYWKQEFSRRWIEYSDFIPFWVSGSGLLINAFSYYKDYFGYS